MGTYNIHLTVYQYGFLTYVAEQEGESIGEIIPNLLDEYVRLVHLMNARGLLPGLDGSPGTEGRPRAKKPV